MSEIKTDINSEEIVEKNPRKNMLKKNTEYNQDSSSVGKFRNLKKISFGKILSLIVLILATVGTTGSVYYYKQYHNLKSNPNIEVQQEVDSLVAAVGKIMELPDDEKPTIATIQDVEKLKDQVFFIKAQNGDKLLAYSKALTAILYRPSSNKIISVGPISLDNQVKSEIKQTNKTTQATSTSATKKTGN